MAGAAAVEAFPDRLARGTDDAGPMPGARIGGLRGCPKLDPKDEGSVCGKLTLNEVQWIDLSAVLVGRLAAQLGFQRLAPSEAGVPPAAGCLGGGGRGPPRG